MKKIFIILLSVLLTSLCLTGCQQKDKSVTIIYTNDVHTYIHNQTKDTDGNVIDALNYSSISALKKQLQENGENVLLVDDGDHSQGTAYGSMDEGATIIQLMNAVGYDVATLGNHEFDYGQLRMQALVSEAEFPYVSCNYYNVQTESLVLPAYTIIESNGVKVAFIGITTPQTITSAAKAYFTDASGNELYTVLGVEDPQDLYDAVQSAIDEIGKKADYIVALGHLGIDESSAGWTSREVIANTTGLDAFIDGHSHTEIENEIVKDKKGNEVTLTQTGCYLNAIGVMRIDNGTITTELIKDYDQYDEEITTLANSWVDKVNELLGEKIAVSDDNLYVTDANNSSLRLVRRMETNAGDLAADSVYYYFNEIQGLDCDVAITNGGGIRVDIPAGDISYLTLKSLEPFGNMDCLIKVTGQQLKDMLELSCKWIGLAGSDGTPAEFGGFLQVAGIKFTVDSSIESTVQTDTEGYWTGGPTGEYRVKDIQIYNRETGEYEDLDLTKEYTIAGNNYILKNGGNGYTMFEGCESILDYIEEDYLVIADYLKAFTVGEDGYAHFCSSNSPLAAYTGYQLDYENPLGSGRITIK